MNREGGEEGIENGVSNHRGREAQEHRSSGSEAGSEAVIGRWPLTYSPHRQSEKQIAGETA